MKYSHLKHGFALKEIEMIPSMKYVKHTRIALVSYKVTDLKSIGLLENKIVQSDQSIVVCAAAW